MDDQDEVQELGSASKLTQGSWGFCYEPSLIPERPYDPYRPCGPPGVG